MAAIEMQKEKEEKELLTVELETLKSDRLSEVQKLNGESVYLPSVTCYSRVCSSRPVL